MPTYRLILGPVGDMIWEKAVLVTSHRSDDNKCNL